MRADAISEPVEVSRPIAHPEDAERGASASSDAPPSWLAPSPLSSTSPGPLLTGWTQAHAEASYGGQTGAFTHLVTI